MRTHVQTAGVSLTAQQPLNNITRTAIEALAGVLGGTQSLHTNSYDEALALPTEDAVRIALRTQQVIAHETGVANTIDPLGGSYFVEALTDEIEARAYEYFAKIDELGGMVEAVKRNYPQREIADAAFALQTEIDARDRIVVGVNAHPRATTARLPILRIDPALERKQIGRVQAVRARRDGAAVERALGALKAAAARDGPQPDAEPARLRARTRHRGRDRRRPPGSLRHLHRDARLLVVPTRRIPRAQAARPDRARRSPAACWPCSRASAPSATRVKVGDNYFVRASGVPDGDRLEGHARAAGSGPATACTTSRSTRGPGEVRLELDDERHATRKKMRRRGTYTIVCTVHGGGDQKMKLVVELGAARGLGSRGMAAATSTRKIRVVVAKPGLDGHDRGAKIIARALRDAGMEVIYTGLHQTPEQIVETVLQEDADAVGLSILSGAHMTLVPRVVELLREQEAGDVVVTVGGTIPAQDIPELKELGVAEVFTPGAPTSDIIDFIRGAVTP